VEDAENETGLKFAPQFRAYGLTSGISVLVRGQKETYGVLAVYSIKNRLFTQEEIHLLHSVANLLALQIERKGADASLRESEERFRQLAENTGEIFWIQSQSEDQVIYVSPAYQKMLGLSPQELYANPTSFLRAVHREDRPLVKKVMLRAKLAEGYNLEFRVITPKKCIRWLQVRALPVYTTDGQVYRLVGVSSDITSQKQVEEKMSKTLEKEKELGELRSRFISMASHEFRTPLTAILSSAEFLEYYGQKVTPEKREQHLKRIQGAVINMTRILDDVLILGKEDAGKLVFNPGFLKLNKFSLDLIEELRPSAKPGQVIEFENSSGGEFEIYTDEKLLRQVLSNLLSNALKYSSPNGGTILFRLERDNQEVIFTVYHNLSCRSELIA
jgi:PAS domain S-box-containing protein